MATMASTTDMDDERDEDFALYGSPFDHERGDLAIRSSDNKLFLVSRMSIEMASSTLQGRLAAMDTITTEDKALNSAGKRLVLALPYSSPTVAHLLSTISPVTLDLPDDFNSIAPLLAAATDLGMQSSLALIRRILPPVQLLQSDPINAYFIACQHGLAEETRRAAEYSIGHRLQLQEMIFSGDLVYKLHVFHRDWARHSRTVVNALTDHFKRTCFQAHDHTKISNRCSYDRAGWSDVLRSSLALALDTPLSINRILLCLNLPPQPMRPTGPFRSQSRYINPLHLDRDKLDAFCLVVEASAARMLASMSFCDAPDSYAFVKSDITSSSSRDKVHDHHNRTDADVILRSCDGVLFKTHKVILSISSPFFQDMFSLPVTVEGEDRLSPRIVQMSEKAATLESLLSVIVPIRMIVPATFPEYALVLAAAQKLDMENAMEVLRVEAPKRLEPSSACSRYGIASRLRLRDEAVSAATELLACPMTIEQYGADLCYLGADALQILLDYRTKCQQALRTALLNEGIFHDVLWRALGSPREVDCQSKSSERANHHVPDWLSLLLTVDTGDHVGLERSLSPWTESYFEDAIKSHTVAGPTTPTCTYCKSLSPSTVYRAMSKELREMVIKLVAFPSWG
ncbi:hypothetical protein PENSPDRAFT_757809 [Peniophora sp. CONT]|nr:hypothetical protein PENSPDRAFT_757809 [Peniophora sp. CONT]